MNHNRGQVLVLFVILVPILLIIATFAIDVGNNYNNAIKLNNINKIVIKYGLDNIEKDNIKAEMVSLLYLNDSDIENYFLDIKDNQITLKITKNVNSIFGGIIGKNFYHLESNYVGYFLAGEMVIEKGN